MIVTGPPLLLTDALSSRGAIEESDVIMDDASKTCRSANAMKRRLLIAVMSALIVACVAPADAAICAPKKLVHLVIVDITPGIPVTSFATKPKGVYRIGSDRLRTEEAADPSNGIHGLIVVSEPNIWMANLYDGTGKHIVDPGPTYFGKAPLFGELLPGKLASLELGCEAAFMAEFAPNPIRQEQVGSALYEVYRVERMEPTRLSFSMCPAPKCHHLHGTSAMGSSASPFATISTPPIYRKIRSCSYAHPESRTKKRSSVNTADTTT